MDRTKPATLSSPMPAPQPATIVHTFKLPVSGKEVTVIEATGRTQRMAIRAAGPKADSATMMFAVIAQVIRVDGRIIPWEAIDAMKLDDVVFLEEEVQKYLSPLATARTAKRKAEDVGEESDSSQPAQ